MAILNGHIKDDLVAMFAWVPAS
ncbi:hypothetical protein MPL1032_220076 [Mesorhizobium plurifarium]|uniref:Uncharacterized protein n=1 Tax=Mesorhizobium plurifarium TaxID=69974 RepID=A0A0K2VZN4_MESPL|nr:hypothetical protein MPL1032_220076 [Mesorhizobium plurifarium]